MADPLHLRFELAGVDRAVIHRTLGKVREGIAGAGEAAVALVHASRSQGGGICSANGAIADGAAFQYFERDGFGHAILPGSVKDAPRGGVRL